jgi:TRAP-type C4-dicarboxylate transport system substrate-binding protein
MFSNDKEYSMNPIKQASSSVTTVVAAAGVSLALFILSGCEQDTALEERAEEAGEQVEETIDTLEDNARSAMDEMGEAAEEATDEAEEVADEARQ